MAALTMAATAQKEPQYISSFKYDKRVHDFGTIKEKDGKVSHTFTFTNTSILPVVISDVNSWCGCTTAEYTKTPILPGKTAKEIISLVRSSADRYLTPDNIYGYGIPDFWRAYQQGR